MPKPSTRPVASAAASSTIRATGGTARDRVLVQRAGRPMATDVCVQIAAPPESVSAAEAAADACMAWLDEVDQRLSRFRPDSELNRLNAAAGREFAASEMLFEAVSLAVSAAHASRGLFDPTLLRQLEALGYDRDFALLAQHEQIHDDTARPASPRAMIPLAGDASAPPMARAAWSTIALEPARRRITLPEGAGIDLGGIAKGWAADVALARYGAPFPGALINVGGDLRARGGPAAGEPWSIGIRHPRSERAASPGLHAASSGAGSSVTELSERPYAAMVTFSRGGLATSGALRRWWMRDGQRQHHLLDPCTGRPMSLWIDGDDTRPFSGPDAGRLIATATALAPTAARAEVAAKMALLRGYPDALRRVEAAWERYGAIGPDDDADAGVALVLTFGTGDVVLSNNLSAYLATWGTEGASLPMNVYP